MEGTTLATIISAITSMITGFAGWIGTMGGVIVENPIMLFYVLLPVIGIGIGGVHRLMRGRR